MLPLMAGVRGPVGKAETEGRRYIGAEAGAEILGRLGGKGANSTETGRTGKLEVEAMGAQECRKAGH